MILTIARKELKETLRERRFVVLAGAMLILLVISVFISRSYYQSVKAQHEQANAAERNVWISQDNKNPHSAAHYGTYAFKPRYPLSLLDQGVDRFSGVAVYLEAHRRNESQYMAAQDQTGLSRFGELTPDFALLYLFPLFIILIAFNAFTREKESGTIKLLQSQGVSLFIIAMGKWAGTMLAMSAVFLPVFLLSFLLLSSLSDFGELHELALGLVFIVYLIYYIVFVNVSLLVSALAKNSSVAFVCLLAFWITACLAIPKVSTNLASNMFPYPSQQQFEAQVAEDEQKGLNGHEPWSDAAKKLEAETLAQYGVARVEDLPVNFDGLLMQKGEEHSAEIYFQHYDLLRVQYRKQAGVYQATSLFSPFLPARFLSMAICSTDYDAHWEFSDAAEQYRIKMMETLNIHFANNSKYGNWDYLADKSLWAEIPPFSFQPATLSQVMGRNSGNIAILFLWVLGTFALLYYVSKYVKTAI